MAQSPNRILVVHCAAGVATSTPNSQSKPEPARRIVSAAQVEDDASFELKLRPKFLREFVGQTKVKENLAVAIEAAKSRGDALDHVLLYGPPGDLAASMATARFSFTLV